MNIHTEIILNAPATDAWRVLGEQFGAIGAWSVSIRTSSLQGELGVGAVRTCQGVGFGPFPAGQVTEKLTHFDPKTMSFTYIGTSGLPWFIKRASNAWSIEAWSPDRCRVRSHAKVELIWWLRPLGFLLPRLARRDMNLFTEELKHQIEQGHAHPRKLATLPA